MSYLGNTPAARFSAMDKQTITGDGGTDYTLDHAVGNEQEIEVFVNNVRQEPSVAYTVLGTALTMTGNVASTDDFYVVFQGKAQQTATHPSGRELQATTGTFSGALSATTGTFTGDVTTTGDFKPTGKEYFHVDLTTSQGSNSSQSTVTVDFGGRGTVKYDTASNFDSANDTYLLGSSDGVYLISFSIGMRSQTIATETIKDGAVLVRVATDGSTFTPIIGSGSHIQDNGGDEVGSVSYSGSFIYKATTATTKIDMQAFCDTASSGIWAVCDDVNSVTDNSPTDASLASITFLSIVRIA
jgi:hypothetical protein